ncbi:hypothetical protein PtA15_15A310 [Puccinia triticina]|uniref:Uncharacterized protein n=1 Tax=Puccinia triticina TaxID=208348 RepID=A0ABY7DAF9_9BASI|nr:uncharacterized protein PtA15_15A310 [Puccinia triticina]WAQ91917.1 hypothetical protein PtA15_15A310 [Puccinia triticina]
MGLMRTPPTKTKSPTPPPPPEQEQELDSLLNSIAPSPPPEQLKPPRSIPKRTSLQELDPFKKKPKLVRSPQQQPSSIPILTRQPKTPRIIKNQPAPAQSNQQEDQTGGDERQEEPEREEEEPEREAEEEPQEEEEEERQEEGEGDENHADENEDGQEEHPVEPTEDPPTHQTSNIPKSTPAKTLQNQAIPSTQTSTLTQTTHPPALTPLPIELPIFKNKSSQPPPLPPQAAPKQTSRRKSRHNEAVKLTMPIEQPKFTAPVVVTTQAELTGHKTFTSRKSFAADYDTSRESNATSLTSNLQFMEHRIEELEELVKILEDERDMSELVRQVQESDKAWNDEWDGSREEEIGRLKLEERIRSMESASKAHELELRLKALELKQLENQLAIKDQQACQLADIINEHQQHAVSQYQALHAELQQLRITNTEWAQIGQNFESLIEIERREKEELQGRYEQELRQSQLEPNFEINTLKYQIVKAENRAERLEEQLREIADQSKNFQAQLISESALKDKLTRELELAECRVRSLSDQTADLNKTLSQLHKGEESNQRMLLQDLLAARSTLAEKEQEIITLNAHLSAVSQPSRPVTKRGREKAGEKNPPEEQEEGEEERDGDEDVDNPARLITSDSWVSIGAVAKKLSRSRQAKGAKTASTTRDTGVGPSSKSATPVIQAPEEEVVGQPEVEAPEQPAHTSPKKRAGKEKAKQPSSEPEDVGSPVATDRREPSVEKNVDEQPAKKSRPARGKAAKKTAKAAVRKNNDEDTNEEVEEEESNEHAAVVAKPRGAKKPVVAVPRGRRKPTTKARAAEPPGEKDPADESDLIVTTNEEEEDGDHGDSAILAIADQEENDNEEEEDASRAGEEEEEVESAAPGPKKGRRPAVPAPPPRSPSPSGSILTPPSPSPAPGKKKTAKTAKPAAPDSPEPAAKKKTKGAEKKKTKAKAKGAKSAPPPHVAPDPDAREGEDQGREVDAGRVVGGKGTKRKSGAAADDDDEEADEGPGARVADGPGDDDDDDEQRALQETLNKKKRKIFHSKKPALAWASHRGEENNMLGLPPELSPVKKSAPRAGAGKKRGPGKAGNILPLSLLK